MDAQAAFVGTGSWKLGTRLAGVVQRRGRNGARRSVAAMRTRLPTNEPGDFYVDSSCIDCDTCRWLAPETFDRAESQSFVHHQPEGKDDVRNALRAAIACPTGSIRTEKPYKEAGQARDDFPIAIDASLEGVYYNGFTSEKSFGATSYLVVDEEVGGILMDSPRYSSVLAKHIQELAGSKGVNYMVLSHDDDIADHVKWAEKFGLTRVMHRNVIKKSRNTDQVEMILDGEGPWRISATKEVLFVPGHSRGDIALYDSEKKAIFTGDFLAYSGRSRELTGFPRYNHYSWDSQVGNIKDVLKRDIEWVLPGHGRRIHFESQEKKSSMLQQFLEHEAVRWAR